MGALSSFSYIPRKWRTPKLLVGLFVAELPLSIAILALFGIAQPNLYRTQFWQEGSDHGWNSNPNQIIYAYANYNPIKAPLPWSQLFALPNQYLVCHIFDSHVIAPRTLTLSSPFSQSSSSCARASCSSALYSILLYPSPYTLVLSHFGLSVSTIKQRRT